MFTTVNNVREYTNKDVTVDLIKRAQSIVEIYVGRSEIDIDRTDDLILLEKMTAYQAAYMLNNEDIVYTQIASLSVGSGDSSQNFDSKMSSPWMAPLAVLAAKGLSFYRGRSIKTGKIFQWNRKVDWRTM
jgi:hypothetical protein